MLIIWNLNSRRTIVAIFSSSADRTKYKWLYGFVIVVHSQLCVYKQFQTRPESMRAWEYHVNYKNITRFQITCMNNLDWTIVVEQQTLIFYCFERLTNWFELMLMLTPFISVIRMWMLFNQMKLKTFYSSECVCVCVCLACDKQRMHLNCVSHALCTRSLNERLFA